MGNAPSNRYCPKHVAEQTFLSSDHETGLISSTTIPQNKPEVSTPDLLVTTSEETKVNSEESDERKLSEVLPELVCNTSTPYGCLGRRFIAAIKTPSPPSIVNDSLNLLGVKSISSSLNQVTYSSHDWILCRDFLLAAIIKNYEKVTLTVDYEREKNYLSDHLDTYGWVERSYQSSGLLRGEIIAPNKFTIDLLIDRPDLRQSLSTKLGPFNISDSGDAITAALTTLLTINKSSEAPVETKEEGAISDETPAVQSTESLSSQSSVLPELLMEVSILSDIFTSQDSINDIITHGCISKIVGEPPAYFKVSVEYLQ